MLYNPAQMDKEELYDTFVAREKLLMELLETIENNAKKKSIQHIILLGARGIGKTHMLRMVENKVFDMPQLQSKWIPVNVPEEQYGIFGLMDFFGYILKIIFHSSKLEKVDRNTYLKELEEIGLNKNKASLDKIVSIFKDIAQKEDKQFLLLIDNIDKILAEKITEEKELEYLRSILMTENFLMFIGTSTSIFEEIALYDKTFFRFFKTIHLQNLNNNEVEELLLKRAEFDKITDKIKLDENKNKIKAITDLTGGYPRLILMLYEILEDKPLLDVLKTFNKLLDNLTPYYKHRMDDLAPQQQKIIDTIMLSDGVASPTDIANVIGWKPTIVTSQFKRLKDLNILKIKESQEISKRKAVYEISDRLFVIWYQMRYMGVIRRRIEYIVTFLKIWYDLAELKDKISVYSSQFQQNYSMGNFSESYSYARSISIMSCAISEVSEKEKIIYEQVNRYINVGKFDDALNDLQDLLKIHEESNNRNGIARDHSNIGKLFWKQGDLKKSIDHVENALKIHEEMGNREGMANDSGNMGMVFWKQGDLKKSIENLEKALKIHEEMANRKGMANDLGNMGIVFWKQGDLKKSIEYLEKALKIHEEMENREEMPSVLGNMGIVFQMQGDIQKSLHHYEKALKIYEEIGNREGMANALGNMGNVFLQQGDLQKSMEYLEKGLKIHDEIGNREGMANDLGIIGNVFQQQGEFQNSIQHYEKALKIHEVMENREGMANDLGNMGIVFRQQGDLQNSIQHYEKALKIHEEMENREGIAVDLSNMGIVFQIQGDIQKSLHHYEKALKIYEDIGNREGMANDLGNIGNVFRLQGDRQNSIHHYEKALKIHEEMGNKKGMANDLGNIGNVFQQHGDLQNSIHHYEKALKIHEEMENREGIAVDLGNMGIVFQMQGDIQKSLHHYEKALKIHEEMGNREGMANQLGNIGNVFQLQGDPQKSIQYLEKALKICEEIGNMEGKANQLGNLGVVFHLQGDLQNSIQHYEKALKIYKEIGDNINYNIIINNKLSLLLRYAITHNKEKNAGKALENLEEIVGFLKETKNEDTIKIIVSAIFELLNDSEYDFVITIIEILQKKHTDIFEICEPFMISAKYLKTNDESILENTSSIVLEGVKKILKAVEKPINEKS